MSVLNPGHLTALDYDRLADEYLHSLPPEHFMEALSQSTQREITIESFALLKRRRPDVQYFNEMLVQYPYQDRIGQVVPDNMVVLSLERSPANTNYAIELEPVNPFLVLEYVSPASQRKDYEVSFIKYEQELKVPYCIMFYPEKLDLRVHHHDGTQYIRMEPDARGRCFIAELDLHVGLLDGWLRFWYRGQLLQLPADLEARVDELKKKNRSQAARLAAQIKFIDQLKEQLQIQQQHQKKTADMLRAHLEERAREAGRDDILKQLAGADLDQLSRWFAELG